MDLKAFDLGQEMHTRKVEYILHPGLWSKFAHPGVDISFPRWIRIKYLNDTGTDFSPAVNGIPDNQGGLYLFFIQCNVISGITEFPLYIGRAQLTDGQNLRKRVKEYFSKYSNSNERPKLHRMMSNWGKDLHLAYYPLPTNDMVKNIERDIINALILPMNDSIPDKTIKAAVKAFK